MRFLSAEEVEELADAIDPRYRALVFAGAYAGLRPGELFGLKVNSLDMLRRQVKVAEALTKVKGQIRMGPPKSKASRRTVTMPGFLVIASGTPRLRRRSTHTAT